VQAQLPEDELWIELAGFAAERHELEKRFTAGLIT
jgi:hypothetical protein